MEREDALGKYVNWIQWFESDVSMGVVDCMGRGECHALILLNTPSYGKDERFKKKFM